MNNPRIELQKFYPSTTYTYSIYLGNVCLRSWITGRNLAKDALREALKWMDDSKVVYSDPVVRHTQSSLVRSEESIYSSSLLEKSVDTANKVH